MDESSSSLTTYSKPTISSLEHEMSVVSPEQKGRIISSIAKNLTELIIENQQNIDDIYIRRDIFYLTHEPLFSIEDYIKHIVKYTRMDISSLILGVIYIDKMCEKEKYVLSFNNINRLILAACLLSIKFNEDSSFSNVIFARIGGVSVELLNKLEYDFYVLMDFFLYVDFVYYQKYFVYFSKCSKLNSSQEELSINF